MATNDRFRANIAKRVEQAKAKQELFYKRLSLEIYRRIVLKSPVDKGRFVNNWNVSYRAANTSTTEATDPSRQQSLSKGSAAVMAMHVDGGMIYITNSLPYAYRLEYEGWSKVKAPAGMVRVTLAELSGVAREVASEVRRS